MLRYCCEVMKEILRYCCEVMKGNINVKNDDGNTPFHYLCLKSNSKGFNMEMLRYCCEVMNADINIKNKYGSTPFNYLCSNGLNMEMVRIIMDLHHLIIYLN